MATHARTARPPPVRRARRRWAARGGPRRGRRLPQPGRRLRLGAGTRPALAGEPARRGAPRLRGVRDPAAGTTQPGDVELCDGWRRSGSRRRDAVRPARHRPGGLPRRSGPRPTRRRRRCTYVRRHGDGPPVARHARAVAAHPSRARSTAVLRGCVESMSAAPHALVVMFVRASGPASPTQRPGGRPHHRVGRRSPRPGRCTSTAASRTRRATRSTSPLSRTGRCRELFADAPSPPTSTGSPASRPTTADGPSTSPTTRHGGAPCARLHDHARRLDPAPERAA